MARKTDIQEFAARVARQQGKAAGARRKVTERQKELDALEAIARELQGMYPAKPRPYHVQEARLHENLVNAARQTARARNAIGKSSSTMHECHEVMEASRSRRATKKRSTSS